MIRSKCLVANILFLVTVVVCDDVEYYPSQAVLDSYSNVAKRSINERKIEKRSSIENEKFRYFNQIKNISETRKNNKRAVDPVFRGHPKTREELWNERFINKSSAFDQTPSLINLIHNITLRYLNDCIPVILYDSQIKSRESNLFQNLLKDFPVSYVHGYIDDNNKLKEPDLLIPVKQCLHFIVFLTEVKTSAKVLGKQSESKIVIVARSSQWAVQEFLASSYSRNFINLLVVGQSFKDDDDNSLVSNKFKLLNFKHFRYCSDL